MLKMPFIEETTLRNKQMFDFKVIKMQQIIKPEKKPF